MARAAANLNNANLAAQQRRAHAQAGQNRQQAAHQARMNQQAQMHQARMARQAQLLARGNQPAGGGGNRGGGGLGDRADIYMHSGAIRAMTGAMSAMVMPLANMEQATVQMEVFTGDAAKAKKVVSELQEMAVISPYGIQQLTESTVLMARYGMEIDNAKETTNQLADIAGGDNMKLGNLSLAMAQITSLGKLQGQELRQLTEHGFNPLKTMAKETGISYATLDAMKKAGMITSDAVLAALKVETSAGGRYAGMQVKMSQTIKGLTQQIQELGQLLAIDIMKPFEEDIKTALRTTIRYIKALREWVKTNEDTVKGWAKIAKNVLIAVVAFHALGLAIAYARWMMHSAMVVGRAFGFVMTLCTMLVNVFVGALTLMRTALANVRSGLLLTQIAAIITWITALGPIALVIAAIGIFIVEIFAAAAAIWVLMFGFQETGKHLLMLAGFFWNFGHNFGVIVNYLGGNWGVFVAYLKNSAGVIGSMFGSLFEFIAFAWKANVDFMMWALKPLKDAIVWLFGSLAKAMPELKFDLPEMPDFSKSLNPFKGMKLPDEVAPPPIPDKPETDWYSLFGDGGKESKGGKAASPTTAIRSGTSAESILEYNTMMGTSKASGKADKQAEMNKVLKMIEKNTRENPKPPVLEEAGLGGID
jgi:tape measure domain-containing protein